MTNVIVPLGGWGRLGWGDDPWGQVDYDKGVGQVGTVTVTGDANVPETGLSATASVGTVTVTADANVSVTGLSSTGQVGTVTITGTAVSLQG
jgi:hypothetical protein